MSRLLLAALFLTTYFTSYSQCGVGFDQVIVQITADSYPGEISWDLKDQSGTTLANGNYIGDTVCVTAGTCVTLTMHDSYGDGICCAYGNGSFTVYLNGVSQGTGGNYTYSDVISFNCPPGFSCTDPIAVTEGTYTAPNGDIWYLYTPSQDGMYTISTCDVDNTCDTKIWIYDHCAGLIWDNSNIGTLYYDDNAGGCTNQAVITAALSSSDILYIRIGGNGTSCSASAIDWSITYDGPITGCMDPVACNYNPLATISSGVCYYWPNVNCPNGPDLTIDEPTIENSLVLDVINASTCHTQENCLTGYGMRDILRFTTWIKNIGQTDYFIGNPANNPGQFTTGNCHGHSHYEGYAEYVLYESSGNAIPIGFKNGFCVLDLECSGGGTAQYGCGNMGITSGCGDIYSSGLDCQWIDITGIADGQYILAVKVNWDQSADALGRVESDYMNNWAQVCIDITHDINGDPQFTINPTCAPYVDCNGVQYGNSVMDCTGDCGGVILRGDLDVDTIQEVQDAQIYVSEIIGNTITPTPCNDLNNDGIISVWDAALVTECSEHGTNFNGKCNFPRGAQNMNQTTELRIGTVNTTQQYVDIEIRNPQNKVLAYEFNMSGITIANVYNVLPPMDFPVVNDYVVGGTKVIGISYVDSTVDKYTNFTPLCRIYYSSLTDTMICIDEIVHIVNENYEATLTNSPACYDLNNVGIDEVSANNNMIVYPNPSNGIFTVEISNFSNENGTVNVNDVTGKVISTYEVKNSTNGKITMDLQTLSKGVYFINYVSEGKNISQRVIVQ